MTTMKQLTDKLATEGGCIVASADCDTIELADARARGDFTVDDAGIGYVRRLPGWLRRHSRFARGATDSCEQRADGEAEPVAYAEFADNGCVRMWSREYGERLPGTRMVPLYTHSDPSDAERLAEALRCVLTWIEAAPHADSCGDADAYNHTELRSCGCGKDAIVENLTEALTAHSAQAQPPAARVTDEYREIARLIGSIFCAGEFKAETWNEKELERLLKKTGNWFDNVDQVPKPFLAAQENPNG